MKHPSPERRREIADDRFTCVFAQPDGSVLFPASGSIKEPLSEWTLRDTGHDTGHEIIQQLSRQYQGQERIPTGGGSY